MKTVDLKIRMEDVNGEKRVNPETMARLLEFGEHRSLCEQCERCFDKKIGTYCATGLDLFQQIIDRPDVQVTNMRQSTGDET